MSDLDLPLAAKRPTYALLIGVVTAMLAAGLAVPAVVGERTDGAREVATGAPEEDLDLSGFDSTTTSTPSNTAPSSGSDQAATDTGATGDVTGSPPPTATSSGGSQDVTKPGPATADEVGGAPVTDASGGGNTASDVGVTADTIKLGLLLPTSEEVGDPNAQRSAQREYFQVFADEINEAGGIHGRELEFVVATYDLIDQEEGARAACLELARDEKVFAAFNTSGYGPPGTLCLTREHGVPFLQGSGHPQEVYAQSGGLYSSNFDSQTRNLANMVWTLDQLEYLKGKKVGMLGTEWIGLRREQEEGIVDTLKLLGYDPFVYWLSGDPVSSQSQIPVAVQQMQANGVEVVLFGADFIAGTSFVQQSESQLYFPDYGAADPWGWSTDFVVSGMPESFAGALTVTAMRTYDFRVDIPEPAVDAECRRTYEERSGNDIDRANDDDALYIGTMWACGVVRRFAQAARAVGPELTRQKLAAALGQLGTIDVPYSGGPGTFVNGKLDGANHYRPQRFDGDCRCWIPLVPGFQPGHYTGDRWR